MKNSIWIVLLAVASCTVSAPKPERIIHDTVTVSVPVASAPCKTDTVEVERIVYKAATTSAAQKKTVDSLKEKLFVANYKVERVRYYLRIVNQSDAARKKYSKFLNSWVSRAVQK